MVPFMSIMVRARVRGTGVRWGEAEVERIVATVAELLVTLSSGLSAGAAVHINLVEYPVRMETDIRPALRRFVPSYHRATRMTFRGSTQATTGNHA